MRRRAFRTNAFSEVLLDWPVALQATREQVGSRFQLTHGESRVTDEQSGPAGWSAVVGMNRMQSKAQGLGASDERIQPVKTQTAEPDYKMHARLMRPDFNFRTRQALQCLDNGSPTVEDLLDRLAQMLLVLSTLDEGSERGLLRCRGAEIIQQLGLVQVVAQRLGADYVAQTQRWK